jgi:23S rRNA (guanosine2251-2'-O)-methyltransferase
MITVPGIRAVTELLRANPSQVKEVWLAKGRTLARLDEVIQICEKEGIPVYFKDSKDISLLLPKVNHQGAVAIVSEFKYTSFDEFVKNVRSQKEGTIVIALDHITDEGNFASILRTAVFFGAKGVIIPKKRSVSVSAQVLKRSSGACFYIPIVKVTNMARALEELSRQGLWIIGTSPEAKISLYEFDWDRDLVLVLGNEQKGIGHSVQKVCHEIVSIPVLGAIDSLNVAVSAGIFLSEIMRQRLKG